LTAAGRARLAAEIVWSYGRVRLSLRRRPLPEVVSGLRTRPEGTSRQAGALDGPRLARAVARTLEALPIDSRCLMRSLVLLRLLARRGMTGRLVVGVAPPARDHLDAHAWVEVAGEPLLAPAGFESGRLLTL
jgi:transglutaminase superfamily protein